MQDVLKGGLPRRFVVQVIGGRLGDRVVTSPVQAFEPSRRYVLFLGPDGPAGPTIFPQAVLEVSAGSRRRGRAWRLRLRSAAPDVLASIQRYLSTGGSP